MKKKTKGIIIFVIVIAVAILLVFAFGGLPGSGEYTFEGTQNDDGKFVIYSIPSKSGNTNGELIIPAELDGKKVEGVEFDMMCGFEEEIKKIILSEGIEFIGNYGFSMFENLEEITLSSSIKYTVPLPAHVRLNFNGNEYLEFKDNCIVEKSTSTVLSAFNGCKIPAGTVAIAAGAFGNVQMTEFALPDTLKRIGAGAFANAKIPSKADITLSADMFSVEDGAFRGLELGKITIEGNVLIEFHAFRGAKIETIVFSSEPRIVVSIDGDTYRNLQLDGNCGMRYYYIIDSVRSTDNCKHVEVQSDLDGYRKYDCTQLVEQEDGESYYTFISFLYE